MALTKEIKDIKIEVIEPYKVVQIEKATIIKEDDVEISRNFHVSAYGPSIKNGNTWEDTDISNESDEIQAMCGTLWSDEVKLAYQTNQDEIESAEVGTP